MEFRLLGPLEVVDDERSLPLGGPKQRSLLAVLLLHAGRVVSTERLIDELWGESPPATVAKSIQVYVSRLRKQLGEDRLLTRAPGYVLHVEPSELDLARFERLVAEARGADPERAARAAARGARPLARATARGSRLRAVRAGGDRPARGAAPRRAGASASTPTSRAGRHAELAGELEGLVAEHPLRERLRGQLMLALYRSGRQAEALETYQAARDGRSSRSSGIEPGRRLRELHQAILAQDPRTRPHAGCAEPAAESASRRVRRPRARARRAHRAASMMPSPAAGACSCSSASPASARAASPRS